MGTLDTARQLEMFERRGAGSDAERRAAAWLANDLTDRDREVVVEPFWCRPNWAAAHAWHIVLALAGSLVSVGNPRLGGAMLLVAVISTIADGLYGVSLGRRLTPERASQNVIRPPARATDTQPPRAVRLVITANYDAGRLGLAYRPRLRGPAARAKDLTGGRAPGWLGWVVIAMAWILVTAILRLQHGHSSAAGVAQLPPTVGLVLALALLLELASSEVGPGAGDNGSGVAIAIALARALDAGPPSQAAVELVLTGAGDGQGIGLRHYLRARRRTLRAESTVVIGVAPCGAGTPRWWESDGSLLPLAFFAQLRRLARELANQYPELQLRGHRGRGSSPALPGRMASLPSLTIGCLDDHDLVPRSHDPADRTQTLDEASLDSAVEVGLLLVDAIDGYLATLDPPARRAAEPAKQA